MDSAILFGFSLCVTGFFTLVAWCWWLNTQVGRRPTSEWIADHCEKKHALEECSLTRRLDQLSADIKEIRDALIGTVDKKGIITRIHEHEEKIDKLFAEMSRK